jgi:hypothetical protein
MIPPHLPLQARQSSHWPTRNLCVFLFRLSSDARELLKKIDWQSAIQTSKKHFKLPIIDLVYRPKELNGY